MSTSIHPARPLGPRTRAASPLPPVRRPEQPTLLTAPSPPNSRSPTPKLGLAIPGSSPSPALSLAPPAASSKPSLKLKLSLGPAAPAARPAADPDEPDSDGFFPGGYYGGPALAPLPLGPKAAGDTTIRPDDTIADTRRPKPPSIGDVTSTLEAMRLRAASNASASSSTILSAASDADTITSTASASSAGNGSGSAIKTPQEHSVEPYPYSDWNDDVFVVQARLGEGAGGAVHEVRDTRTGIVMARKTIQTREAPMKQLLRELNLITTISHPNIIRFFGAYMSPSSSEVKVVMEVCEGRSLESVGKNIRGRGLRVGEKVAGRLAEGVLQGLAYLRSKDLIHRDIKPSNILLSRDGVVKLCDFGVSGELVGSVVDTFTGTSLYMAPERLSGLEYSIRADVWSTGLSILELVQNRFPFSADLAPIELMIHITQSEPPQLEDEDGFRWSDEMKDFINQTLRVDPALRPTPKDLLSHPWIVHIMAIDVNMARWIREVWGWPKPARKPKDGTS